jgi:VWFA-related protein
VKVRIALCISALSISCLAQQQPDITFKKRTQLVQVPVLVTDSRGKHVEGLTKDDFTITENKQLRTISVFEEVKSTSDDSFASAKVEPGEYTNIKHGADASKSILIILFDGVSMNFADQASARSQLMKMLQSQEMASQRFCLFITNREGIQPIHLFTTDPKVLIEAVRKLKSDHATIQGGGIAPSAVGPVSLDGASVSREISALNAFMGGNVEQDDIFAEAARDTSDRNTVATLKKLAKYFATVPGRKSLLWIAGYFANGVGRQSSADYSGGMLGTLEALNNANIALYPISAKGLETTSEAFGPFVQTPVVTTLFQPQPSRAQIMNPMVGNLIGGDRGVVSEGGSNQFDAIAAPRFTESMKSVAERTGGIPFYNTNDIAGAMRKAADDGSQFYLLGYYLPEDQKPGRYELAVKVNRPGVKVRSRSRLFVQEKWANSSEELDSAKSNFLEFTGLPLKVKIDQNLPRKQGLGFEIFIDGKEIGLTEKNEVNLDVIAVARRPEGAFIQHLSRTVSGKVRLTADFRVRPVSFAARLAPIEGPAVLRFIVRDNVSGRIGSIIVEPN